MMGMRVAINCSYCWGVSVRKYQNRCCASSADTRGHSGRGWLRSAAANGRAHLEDRWPIEAAVTQAVKECRIVDEARSKRAPRGQIGNGGS